MRFKHYYGPLQTLLDFFLAKRISFLCMKTEWFRNKEKMIHVNINKNNSKIGNTHSLPNKLYFFKLSSVFQLTTSVFDQRTDNDSLQVKVYI